MKKNLVLILLISVALGVCSNLTASARPRVIATTDGEIDDQCSMVRFLLYANEWDIEGIITSSSQYHWHGHNWAGDDWVQPYLDAYAKVYPNLVKHDSRYPTLEYLQAHTLLGNVETEGDMNAGCWPNLQGGQAPIDSDHDGMPDAWETAHGLDPSNKDDGKKTNLSADSFTNLEMYLNELAGDPVKKAN